MSSRKTQKRRFSKVNNANNADVDEGNTDLQNTKQINPCNTKTQAEYDKLKKILSQNNIEKGKQDLFNCIIMNNSYVDLCFRNSQRDTNSFYSLIKRDLSQSDAIKLGVAIEKIFVDIILTNPQLTNIRESNKKGQKETDHLFLNETTNTVYYAEVKGNLKLDTEKRQATIKKIQDIAEKIRRDKKLKPTNVETFLFAPRYFSTSLIPKEFRDSYKEVSLIGVNEYLSKLGVNYKFANEDEYKEKINLLAYRMFVCISLNEIEMLDLQRTALGESFIKIPAAPKKHISTISRTLLEQLLESESPSRPRTTTNHTQNPDFLAPKELSFNNNNTNNT